MTDPNLISCSSTSAVHPVLENLGHDPKTCEHEWYEETGVVYASYPPCYKQQCRLCGSVKFRRSETSLPQGPRWERVLDDGNA